MTRTPAGPPGPAASGCLVMRITVTAARSRRRASQPGSALPGAPDHDGGASSSSHWHGFASRGSGCQAPGHWPPSGSRHARPPASDRAGPGPGLRLGSVARFTVALAGRTAGLLPVLPQKNRFDCGVLGRRRGVQPAPQSWAGAAVPQKKKPVVDRK